MPVPFNDLKGLYLSLKDETLESVSRVLDSGWYLMGKECEHFELEMANSLSKKTTVVGCNSGTDALILALRAGGVQSGDEVITVAHTAVPTICAIIAVGAKPIFADVDENSWVMDIEHAKSLITQKTKAIIPVHLYGAMVDVFQLNNEIKNIFILEDVAQAQGATLAGSSAGTIGRFGAYSFYPTKNLGAMGDGGAITALNAEDGERLKLLRYYGQKSRYDASVSGGINSRLNELQAAILRIRLKKLESWIRDRARKFEKYKDELSGMPIRFQVPIKNCKPAWHLCVLRLESEKIRDQLQVHLKSNGIETVIHYPKPNHLQSAFVDFSKGVQLPKTEKLAGEILSIPFSHMLSEQHQSEVIRSVRSFFK